MMSMDRVMKDVRFWRTALVAADLQLRRYERLTGAEPNLGSYWPVTEHY